VYLFIPHHSEGVQTSVYVTDGVTHWKRLKSNSRDYKSKIKGKKVKRSFVRSTFDVLNIESKTGIHHVDITEG
jgi:hypothetical protein